jgi:prophage maintenance system killer protein
VLCGTDPAERRRFHRHLEASEAHFYSAVGGGIRAVMEWYERHRHDDVWSRAAGVYVHALSEPQLFVEGNHRAGALIMSLLLVREGKPPFVVKADNAKGYFDPSALIRVTRKHTMTALWRLPRLKRTFAEFLRARVDKKALIKARPPLAAE